MHYPLASALSLDHVTKTFQSGFTAVNSITCTIAQGTMVGLLGPNGAGKTTLMHLLLGILSPTSGGIYYFGKKLTSQTAARSDVLKQVGFASSYVRLPGKLSVQDNLLFYGQLYGQTQAQARERMTVLLKTFDLYSLKDQACYSLSAGQATRLTITKAFMGFPKIVLLDEPTAALDVDIAESVLDFIKQQQRTEGTTILFTSHKIEEVSTLCEQVLVIQKGTLVAYAPPAQLIQKYAYSQLKILTTHPEAIMNWAQDHQYLAQQSHGWVLIDIPDAQISHALAQFTGAITEYDQIAIEPPSLQQYFTRLAAGEIS